MHRQLFLPQQQGDLVSGSWISFATKSVVDNNFYYLHVRLAYHFRCYHSWVNEKVEKRRKFLVIFIFWQSKSNKYQLVLLFGNLTNKLTVAEIVILECTTHFKWMREPQAVKEIHKLLVTLKLIFYIVWANHTTN